MLVGVEVETSGILERSVMKRIVVGAWHGMMHDGLSRTATEER
jgi:hypothetical protein